MEQAQTVGQLLKQRRETLGISLEKTRLDTRITIKYLTAIENDKWDTFPAKVYVLGFLKKYAEYLGLEKDSIINIFNESQREQKSYPKKTNTKKVIKEPKTGAPKKNISSVKYIIFILVFVVGIGGYAVFKYSGLKIDIPKKWFIGKNVVTVPSIITTAIKRQEIVIHAFVDTWVRVIVDSRKEFEGILIANKDYRWEAKEKFNIKVGYVRGVEVKFNGEVIDLLSGARYDVNEIVLPKEK